MKYTYLLLILILSFFMIDNAQAQIIAPTGVPSRATSQLIYFYNADDNDALLQVTNTNDTVGTWIHVQIFRSFNPDNGDDSDSGDANVLPNVICDERDFVDFLTPNDTHVYDLDEENFPKNMGETATEVGESTALSDQLDNTLGFVVITPVVSESDFTAISFQHLIGTNFNQQGEDYVSNAMGRDAVNFLTGEFIEDGTPLDGVNNGFVVIQPEELLWNVATDDVPPGDTPDDGNIIGISFIDSYGPSGLLGYGINPGSVTWTSFIFDFKEDPTSCGNRPVECFLSVGLNDSIEQDHTELNPAGVDEDLLCPGTILPEYPFNFPAGMGVGDDFEQELFGWIRSFVSGYDDFENHIGFVQLDDIEDLYHMYTRGERTEIITEPPAEVCDDGIDNDEDGFTDCADSDCTTNEACETGAAECTDGMDNDEDGATDCADLGCDGTVIDSESGAACETGGETSCDDGFDNDGDGLIDGDDSDCMVADTGGDDGDGGGCMVATAVTTGTAAANFLLPLLPLAGAYGYRRLRRRSSK